MMRAPATALLVSLLGCAPPPPERVFVPGTPFKHVVEVSTAQGSSPDVRVGEWLTLHARRATGPWVEVERKSLGPEGCWIAPPPPPEEAEVADNLRWTTEPADRGEFNLQIQDDHTRRVRFSAPGQYALKASSSTYCRPGPDANSNTLSVTVRP